MKVAITLACFAFVAVAFAARLPGGLLKPAVVTQAFVDELNSMDLTWKAGLNKGSTIDGKSLEEARILCGVLPGGPKLPEKKWEENIDFNALPESFDSRTNWPQCQTMTQIRDQSACGSCWAFGSTEAMSDRMCVTLKMTNTALSSGNMAFCCGSCGDGCGGGFPSAAWQHWVQSGIVEEPCYPYPFPSCDHHIPSSKNPCPSQEYPNPPCPGKCTNKTWAGPAWKQDKHFGASAYSVTSVNKIMAEIAKNGPVEAAFDVYADFLTYTSGVYAHKTGQYLGGHAIKVLGWGVDNGTPYWICANSWNPNWGNHGYFWIKRGVDECGIEDGVVAGIPKN